MRLYLSGTKATLHPAVGRDRVIRLLTAVTNVLANSPVCTRDLGGTASTEEFTKAVLDQLA